MSVRNVTDLKKFLKGCDALIQESLGYNGNSGDAAKAVVVSELVGAYFDGSMNSNLFNEILKEGEKK